MKRTKWFLLPIGALILVLAIGEWRQSSSRRKPNPPHAEARPAAIDGPRMQIALLLDTSGSMEGLLNQARTQLWNMVTELTKAKQDGKRPHIELALYAYGLSDNAEGGYLRQLSPFSTELDRISEQLFALHTTGSEEYCGQVIQTATNDLAWSTNPDDLKLIFIAGNESFGQGPVNPLTAVKDARERGITVNTIHCGPDATGIQDGWQQAALTAGGRYMVIDHNETIAEVATPQDAELARLNNQLNHTYLPYGAQGAAGIARQQAQDKNAQDISLSNSASRAVTKAGTLTCDGIDSDCDGYYDNRGWDLVDAARKKSVKLDQLADAELPPELRGKTPAEREALVQAKRQERFDIQERIRKLGQERNQFLAQARQQHGGASTFDQAMMDTVHEQAAHARFTFQ